MKQIKSILLVLLGLVFSLSASAQSVVTGSNLNIGTNNTLSGTVPRGNAIGENHWLEGVSSLVVGIRDTILEVSTGSMAFVLPNLQFGSVEHPTMVFQCRAYEIK